MLKAEKFKSKNKTPERSKFRINWEVFLQAIFIAIIIRLLIFEAFQIPSASMIPTLNKDDMLFVNKFSFGTKIPLANVRTPQLFAIQHGDILVFEYPLYESVGPLNELLNIITFGIYTLDNYKGREHFYIKRVVGLPGDTITYNNRTTTINDATYSQEPHQLDIPKNKRENYSQIQVFKETINPAIRKGKSYTIQYFNSKDMPIYGLYIPKKGDTLRIEWLDSSADSLIFFNTYINDLQVYGPESPKSDKMKDFCTQAVNTGLNMALLDYSTFEHYYKCRLPEKIRDQFDNHESFSFTLPFNMYLMMGDNRNQSYDSRFFGLITDDYILGTPLIRHWPFFKFKID